jgi:hypothetical protein
MKEKSQNITVQGAAKLLMVTARHVQRLAKDGWISKPYTVLGVVHGYIKWRNESERLNTQKSTRAGADEVRTKLLQLRLDQESKKVIPLDEALNAVNFVCGTLKSEFVGFPAAVTRDRTERARLEDAVDAIFTRAVERIEEEAARIRANN